jgi:hypothetical protein
MSHTASIEKTKHSVSSVSQHAAVEDLPENRDQYSQAMCEDTRRPSAVGSWDGLVISRRDPEWQVAGGAGHRATLQGELGAWFRDFAFSWLPQFGLHGLEKRQSPAQKHLAQTRAAGV